MHYGQSYLSTRHLINSQEAAADQSASQKIEMLRECPLFVAHPLLGRQSVARPKAQVKMRRSQTFRVCRMENSFAPRRLTGRCIM